jgi:selenide,water dikinase
LSSDPALLVGPETADDAGVYRIGDSLALVETADIITPLVDDPFTFGRIAAANALSDVYAMGGRPVTAMNLVFFPACAMEMGILKYGLSVTGLVHPERIIRNSTARPGDRLILTKPLGTGIIATAVKADMAPAGVVDEANRWMTTLNRGACAIMLEFEAHACTDVTGFGLIGHACEMARGGGVTLTFQRERVPLIAGVEALIMDGLVPAGCYRNRDHFSRYTAALRLSGDDLLPLFDPQTSGGLLIALAPPVAARFLEVAGEKGCFAACIGEVVSRREHMVEFV